MNESPTFIHKIIKAARLATYVRSFEDVSCFTSTFGEIKNHAAVALPGIGIFIHPDDMQNIPLLRHEYGHMLQAQRWGKPFFYQSIAWTSLTSARKSSHDPTFVHQHTWTEWTANKLSYEYFKHPVDWDMEVYPIQPPLIKREGTEVPVALAVSGKR